MLESDWSQFIPDLIVGVFLLLIPVVGGGIFAYFRSNKFRNWINKIFNNLSLFMNWIKEKKKALVIFSIFVAISFTAFLIYRDWRFIVLINANFLAGLFFYKFLTNSSYNENKIKEKRSKFLPIPIQPGLGGLYFEQRYLNPPSGERILGQANFSFQEKPLIFDTNKLHYYSIRYDGSKEIELRLPKPVNFIKSAYFLINSGNSKKIYSGEKIGEIILVFRDAPLHVTDLILGGNIREWCPGNKGEYVRKTSNPSTTMDVWTGMNNEGTLAVIDSLKIQNYECMRNNYLEKIIFVHRPTNHLPEDEMGVHFSIFGISLEIYD